MKDLLFNSARDLDVSNHDLHLVDGAARVGQQVVTVLRSFLGEYDFDLNFGVDWRGSVIGVKPINLKIVQQVIQDAILGVPDVVGFQSFDVSFDSVNRAISIDTTIITSFGPTAVTGVFP